MHDPIFNVFLLNSVSRRNLQEKGKLEKHTSVYTINIQVLSLLLGPVS